MIATRLSLRRIAVACCASLALHGAAFAQAAGEAAVTRRATELRESPSDSGRSLGALAASTPVTRLDQRQGPWLQVRNAAGQTGWLHMFDVGPAGSAPAAQPSTTGGALRSVTNLFSRQPQTSSTATSTIGIRGLGAEDIANAQPNLQAVAQAESHRQTEAQARDFASRAQLQARRVDPLPAPARGAQGNPQ